ncbi:type II toxin-antitoxin system VapB family antitoxin [Streptomyces sp. NPDC055721]|uniref:type II toxin-antitoxin system VapB family antitoxin n=1 Tax=Streptomyces sp. NPDC127132 TaxID=3345374 RepID=UPI00363CEFF2
MAVTRIDIDEGALQRAMSLSKAGTKEEAVNLALRFYADQHEHAARISRHFERAHKWGAVEDAAQLQQAEKDDR